MAAGPWKVYDIAVSKILRQTDEISLETDQFRCLLLSSAYTPDPSHLIGDITPYEIANGNGYTTGGVALTGTTITDNAGIVTFSSDNIDWLAVGGSITARYAVIKDNPMAYPVCVALLDTTPSDVVAVDGKTFLITIGSGGIFKATARAQW